MISCDRRREDLRKVDRLVGLLQAKTRSKDWQMRVDAEIGCLSESAAEAINQLPELPTLKKLTGKKRLARLTVIAAKCEGLEGSLLRQTEKKQTETNKEHRAAIKSAQEKMRLVDKELASIRAGTFDASRLFPALSRLIPPLMAQEK